MDNNVSDSVVSVRYLRCCRLFFRELSFYARRFESHQCVNEVKKDRTEVIKFIEFFQKDYLGSNTTNASGKAAEVIVDEQFT